MSKTKYTIKFIESLKTNCIDIELPTETINNINIIDDELNKYFKFLLTDTKKTNKKKNQDNSWRLQTKRKKLFSNEDENDNFKREINLMLNKININNYDKIKKTIINMCKDIFILEYTVESMFQKVLAQPCFCDCYVKLYKELIFLGGDHKDNLVYKLISTKCDSFLNIHTQENTITEEQNEYDKICELYKQKDYIKGYSQFIGELYNNDLIEIDKINIFINSILINVDEHKQNEDTRNNTEELIYSLYVIINCIILKIHKIDICDNIENKMKAYSLDKQLTSKGRFKFMDILDLLKK